MWCIKHATLLLNMQKNKSKMCRKVLFEKNVRFYWKYQSLAGFSYISPVEYFLENYFVLKEIIIIYFNSCVQLHAIAYFLIDFALNKAAQGMKQNCQIKYTVKKKIM